MFTIIQGHQYERHAELLDQMFRLRKRVFADQLGWDVPVQGEHEQDGYDRLKPAYLVWCDDDMTTLYGSARLMPTTHPTLLHDVFDRTMPKDAHLEAPGIWECTRLCVDEDAIKADGLDINARDAFRTMLVAICEVAVEYGIHTVASNYEPHVMRLYRSAGATIDEIGRAEGYGKRPVCCGLFETTDETLSDMREAVGIEGSLLTLKRRRTVSPSKAAVPAHIAARATSNEAYART